MSRRQRRALKAEDRSETADVGSASAATAGSAPEAAATDAAPLSAPTPAPAASEPEAPAAISPTTPFDQVVAPPSAGTPVVHGTTPEDAEYYAEDLHGEPLAEEDDYEVVPEDALPEHIEEDEHGTRVVVGASDFGRGYQMLAPAAGSMNRSTLLRRRAKRRRRNVTLAVAFAGFAILVFGFIVVLQSFLGREGVYDYDTQAGETVDFEVVSGDGLETVANRLLDEEIIASRDAFWDSLNELKGEPIPQPGTFELREEMPAEDAVAVLFGDGEATYYISLNAGTRVDDALERIAQETDVTLQELQVLNDEPQQFGLPDEAQSLEGYLAAGEYRPSLDATAEDVIEEMVEPTFDYFDDLGLSDEDEQWRTVIIASLITAEANHGEPEDYPLIAGAIENRLDPDNTETEGLLQIDAAVNYGLEGETGLHFTEEDRLDESNPYNTYQHTGLPPGPIATPTPSTLDAAANPADTDYIYWVTVNIATGETEFNETYDEHQEDVEEFLRWCREEDEDELCGPAEVEAAEDTVEE